MPDNDTFDLVLAIPCMKVNVKKDKSKKHPDISTLGEESFKKFSDAPLKCGDQTLPLKNSVYDNGSNLYDYAKIFCEQIDEHANYELVFNDKNSNMKIERMPLLFGQVILYEDEKTVKFSPKAAYNFFCVCSELTVNKGPSFRNDSFNTIYFVVPDICYEDLTLLMDQAHELWVNVMGNADTHTVLIDYLDETGYKYMGKIYHIIFSDINQYNRITENEKNKTRIFNILAAEAYKEEDVFAHQIELSEDTNDYAVSYGGKARDITLSKKEKFFDSYNMYSSYKAYASLYSFYYVINEENKGVFCNRISPDEDDEDFSSEANILFVLETEIFKITACLVLSMRINEQINNPNMGEIQTMFKSFINTRPLFEKLNYRYLGAQKEADFINRQFRIDDALADYDRKKELLRDYCDVVTSISTNKNSKILNCIGLFFAFVAGFDKLVELSGAMFDNKYFIPGFVFIIIQVIIIMVIGPIRRKKV